MGQQSSHPSPELLFFLKKIYFFNLSETPGVAEPTCGVKLKFLSPTLHPPAFPPPLPPLPFPPQVWLTQHGVTMQAEFHGMLPVAEGAFEPLQQSAMRRSNRLKQACAVCHSLTVINKTIAVGEAYEQHLFKAVEAHFQARVEHLLVTSLLLVFYQSITSLLPVCYQSVTSLLPAYYQSFTILLLQCDKSQLPVAYHSIPSQLHPLLCSFQCATCQLP